MNENPVYPVPTEGGLDQEADRKRQQAIIAFLKFSRRMDRQLRKLERKWAPLAAPGAGNAGRGLRAR
jgi:hypothetical protein